MPAILAAVPVAWKVGAAAVAGTAGASIWIYEQLREKATDFPISTFRKRVREAFGRDVFTVDEVIDYWETYLSGVTKEGLKPFDVRDNPTPQNPGQQPIVEYMVDRLGGKVTKARLFGLMLQTLATEGKMSRLFWLPLQSQEAKEAAAQYSAEVEEKMDRAGGVGDIVEQGVGAVKWVAFAVLGVAGFSLIQTARK